MKFMHDMRSNNTVMYYKIFNYILIVILFSSISFCAGAAVKDAREETAATGAEVEKEDVYAKDPFFTAPVKSNEYFRILITEDGYYLKNVGNAELLDRKPDAEGDNEQYKVFKKYNDEYDFKDWVLTAVMRAKLNPHRGELEHLEYLPGFNPKSWQSGKLFQEDLSRFHFIFPGKDVLVYEFLVSYEWRIKARKGLTEEEARRRAIEYLNSQVQGR